MKARKEKGEQTEETCGGVRNVGVAGARALLTALAAVAVAAAFLLAGVAAAAQEGEGARPPGAPVPVRQADEFVDSVGVNTHAGYGDTVYGDFALLKEKIGDLGVEHVRDAALVSDNDDAMREWYERYEDLHDSFGTKSTLIVDEEPITREDLGRLAAYAGDSLEAVEGPNEVDCRREDFAEHLRSYGAALYDATNADPATAGIPVVAPSVCRPEHYREVGDLSGKLDYGNAHAYPGGRNPGTPGWGGDDASPTSYGSLGWYLGYSDAADGAKETVVTETGYHNASAPARGHEPVPEDVSGKYVPRLVLNNFNAGVRRTFLYELLDLGDDPEVDQENFGLVRNDGTDKPAYTALKNLIALLDDDGAPHEPEALEYALSGDTGVQDPGGNVTRRESLGQTLLQKRDGRYYLVLWSEGRNYDVDADAHETVPARRVTLDLPAEFSARSYKPHTGLEATERGAGTSFELDVPDHPLVVELAPAGGPQGTAPPEGNFPEETLPEETAPPEEPAPPPGPEATSGEEAPPQGEAYPEEVPESIPEETGPPEGAPPEEEAPDEGEAWPPAQEGPRETDDAERAVCEAFAEARERAIAELRAHAGDEGDEGGAGEDLASEIIREAHSRLADEWEEDFLNPSSCGFAGGVEGDEDGTVGAAARAESPEALTEVREEAR